MSPLLTVRDLAWEKAPGQPVFASVNFSVDEGDVVVLTGKSGSGKSTLLKCLAHLNLYSGQIEYHGQTPKSIGIPLYRTRVLYVPQRPALLPGSPRTFLNTIHSFKSRQNEGGAKADENTTSAAYIAHLWGIENELWDRDWASLSGGEAQRMSLAIALGIKGAEVLLLDEPTSALDGETVDVVEKYLKDLPHSNTSSVKAIVCVTHSEDQAAKIGTRRFRMENGRMYEAHDV